MNYDFKKLDFSKFLTKFFFYIKISAPRSQQFIRSYKDTEYFKDEINEKQLGLYFLDYYDEFDTKDGPSSSDFTKIHASYFTIANLDYAYQCNPNDIIVNTIASKLEFLKIGKDNFFKIFKELVLELNADPIKLSDGYFIQIHLAASLNDNKASNELQYLNLGFEYDAYKYCENAYGKYLMTSILKRRMVF